jgi:hypothetical protein
MRWYRSCALAGLVLAAVATFTPARFAARAAAQAPCLHGADESAEQAARRKQALGFTRHINTHQADWFRKNKAFGSLEQLPLTQTKPGGFDVKVSADAASYAFAVIDQTDPCRLAFFSNDAGVIYRGEALR